MQRLWDFCDVLRDDGLSYGDYLEQLTYLLFLKMADEQHELLGDKRVVPIEYDWQSLLSRSGAALEAHYSENLSELGTRHGAPRSARSVSDCRGHVQRRLDSELPSALNLDVQRSRSLPGRGRGADLRRQRFGPVPRPLG